MSPMFLTESGLSVPAVTADQMVEVDRVALEETGPTRFQMMENTGHLLAQQALDCLQSLTPLQVVSDTPILSGSKATAMKSLTAGLLAAGPQAAQSQQGTGSHAARPQRVVVLAGGGMNGGGGICAAKHLAKQGLEVYLCLSNAAALTNISCWQYHLFQSGSGQEVTVAELTGDRDSLSHSLDHEPAHPPIDLVIDALMGCRVAEAPKGNDLALINWANGQQAPVLSLDIPSGMDATQGETPGAVMQARWTMTLALPKTGLHPEMTGELILADIGIPAKTYRAKSLKLTYRSPFQRGYRVPLQYQGAMAGAFVTGAA